MAKTPVIRTVKNETTEAAPVAKTQRNRSSVLISITAAKLHSIIGDAEIGVSRKELTAFISKDAVALAFAKALA